MKTTTTKSLIATEAKIGKMVAISCDWNATENVHAFIEANENNLFEIIDFNDRSSKLKGVPFRVSHANIYEQVELEVASNNSEGYCNICCMESTFDEAGSCEACGNHMDLENSEKDEEIENLAYENKMMAEALVSLGFTQEQISSICSGGFVAQIATEDDLKQHAVSVFVDEESTSAQDYNDFMEENSSLTVWEPFESFGSHELARQMRYQFSALQKMLKPTLVRSAKSEDDECRNALTCNSCAADIDLCECEVIEPKTETDYSLKIRSMESRSEIYSLSIDNNHCIPCVNSDYHRTAKDLLESLECLDLDEDNTYELWKTNSISSLDENYYYESINFKTKDIELLIEIVKLQIAMKVTNLEPEEEEHWCEQCAMEVEETVEEKQKRLLNTLNNVKGSYLGMNSPAGFTPITKKEFIENYIDGDLVSYGVYDEAHKLRECAIIKKNESEIACICQQCEQMDILNDVGICSNCDRLNRKSDFESGDGTIEITLENIHLYREFMSNEDYVKKLETLEIIKQDQFNYMMLSRLSNDAVQFLSEDSFSYKKVKNLWAGDIDEQIEEMRKIYNKITIKPEWLTMDEINTYENKMKALMGTSDIAKKDTTKFYSIRYNVGKVKYLISYHDGIKTHKDGSPFSDIATFSNKKLLDAYEKDLLKNGYVYR